VIKDGALYEPAALYKALGVNLTPVGRRALGTRLLNDSFLR
jgi:hypothetical protein